MSKTSISNLIHNLLKQKNIIPYKWNNEYHITRLSYPHENRIIILYIKDNNIFDEYGFCVGTKEEFNFLKEI